MIVAKDKKCAEGFVLNPFNALDIEPRKKAGKIYARCRQCGKWRCKVEVVEK